MRAATLLRTLLRLQDTVVVSASFEGDALLVQVRPLASHAGRCGICRSKCPPYDRGTLARRWRGLDAGTTQVYLVADQPRVRCPRHGVVAAHAPWARPGARFTRSFEDQVAWLATTMSKTAVCELMRVSWRSVGRIIARVVADNDRPAMRLKHLRWIGIDEISYRRGQRYLTLVVDHESGDLAWAAEGRSRRTVNAFLDALGEDGCAQLELVSRDAAEWIRGPLTARCPNAIQCMDPFHVVTWATEAVDELRRRSWQDLRNAGWPIAARNMKQTRWALLKNADALNDAQKRTLSALQVLNKPLYRAYLIKEQLRMVFQASPAEAEELLEQWLKWARRCRIPEMVAVAKSVTTHRTAIVAALRHKVSNARIEATNTGIRLLTRIAYGFHSAEAIIAMAMLKHGGLCPPLPDRA